MSDLSERRKRYEERKQAKIERYKELASKHAEKSKERASRSSQMASAIPMGQPIHVGHHSEKADRAFRNRIDSNMRKAVEHETVAEHYESRAEKLSANDNIYADDPDAIAKLKSKVESLERLSGQMKEINAFYKKNKTLVGSGLSEAKIASVMSQIVRGNGRPFETWEFTNIRGRIKTANQRIEALGKADSFKPFGVNGITVELVDGQIQINFGFKPNEEIRTKLKSHPLSIKWSSYSHKWVRKYTGQGPWWFEQLKNLLETAKEESV